MHNKATYVSTFAAEAHFDDQSAVTGSAADDAISIIRLQTLYHVAADVRVSVRRSRLTKSLKAMSDRRVREANGLVDKVSLSDTPSPKRRSWRN